MTDRDYLTTAEVADYLRLKERTIYDLVARKAIPCSRVTGKLIFPRHLIDRWLDANVDVASRPVVAPPPIMAGSSDPLLEWALRESESGLASLFEGSETGLKRFAAGQALAVGLHLYDRESGAYNVAAVRPLAPVCDLVLVQWARREQGLVVAKGNPLRLQAISDLGEKGPRIVARQAGSGAQLLFQALLDDQNVDASALVTLGVPALTETDVATAVADGQADCGLAVGAVAKRFGLDFVPLHRERFDIACRRRDYFEPALQRLFAFARTAAFRDRAEALGYYDLRESGRVEFNA